MLSFRDADTGWYNGMTRTSKELDFLKEEGEMVWKQWIGVQRSTFSPPLCKDMRTRHPLFERHIEEMREQVFSLCSKRKKTFRKKLKIQGKFAVTRGLKCSERVCKAVRNAIGAIWVRNTAMRLLAHLGHFWIEVKRLRTGSQFISI